MGQNRTNLDVYRHLYIDEILGNFRNFCELMQKNNATTVNSKLHEKYNLMNWWGTHIFIGVKNLWYFDISKMVSWINTEN